MNIRKWFEFEIKHWPTSFVEEIAFACGDRSRIYYTTGKVSALTMFGAKRCIRRRWGRRLIEIVSIERSRS